MVSFFILCMFIKAMGAQNTSICVWGITVPSPSNPKINGEYLYSGIHNNYPYYTMAVDTTCSDTGEFVLYYSAFWDQWWITKELDSIVVLEECDSPSPNDPLTTGGCQNKWIDANMRVTSGSCPEWDCDGITTSWQNTHNCGATFDTHIAPNVYKASSNGAYLYYNHHLGEYFCGDYIIGCPGNPGPIWDLSLDPWMELLKGSSIDVLFSGIGVDKTLYCMGYTTSPTTNYPTTMLPTTAIPTTHFPTTINPTSSPSTAMPTTLTPTSLTPTSLTPTTLTPTTLTPTTVIPTTNTPTTSIPTIIPTLVPTITNEPSTHIPTTDFPNTVTPTTNEEEVSDEVSTTMPFDTRSHSQNNQELFLQSRTFVIIIICIVLILISCAISVSVFIQKQKQNKNTATGTKNILNNIELAPQVNNVTNIDDMDNITATAPVRIRAKSLSDDSNVISSVDNGNLSENCNVENNGNDGNVIFAEGNGNDSDGEDLYQPNNDITPQGTTAGNDQPTRQ